ncbi:MAG: hypothetical protein FJ037_06560 [Chloroflexi bacterium]|nr:hypothetical protein [Chloroflexota bacterium]
MIAVLTVQPWLACDAAAAAARLRGRPGLAWLDSSLVDGRLGRWSIIASDPRWTLTGYEDGVLLECAGAPRRFGPGALHVFARLTEREPRAMLPADAPDVLPFAGVAIGNLGFELGREIERIPATTRNDTGAPVLAFGWYDAGARQGRCRTARLARGADGGGGGAPRAPEAAAGLKAGAAGAGSVGLLRADMTRRTYLEAVQRAQAYIAAGEIYQST